MKRFKYRPLTALITFGAISGIGSSVGSVNEVSAQSSGLSELARQCGLTCPGDEDLDGNTVKTLVQGNAAISGVVSVDSFFGSVLDFRVKAKSVAGGINAELEGIRADFDLDPKAPVAEVGGLLKAKLEANLVAGFELRVDPPQCKVDLKAEIQAAARCDAEVTPAMISVECKGGCDLDVKVKAPECEASANLSCTLQLPEGECSGECSGSCTGKVGAQVDCQGTCHGACEGSCDAYVKNTEGKLECAGKCTGMCMGSCEVELAASASCDGSCRGECKLTKAAKADCEGAISASCSPGEANASIKCDTKCDGEFEPPMVKAECKAKVEADAKLNVQCTPPRVTFDYQLAASIEADVDARFRFESALNSLVKVRLPALKAAVERSKSIQGAGVDLSAAATGAVKGAIEEVRAEGKLNLRLLFGLGCAVDELPNVKVVIDESTKSLTTSLSAAAEVEGAFGG
jgi:hypothetical protein